MFVPRNVPLCVRGAWARNGYATAAVAVDTRSPGSPNRVRSLPCPRRPDAGADAVAHPVSDESVVLVRVLMM
jgi:hypothetical protein